MTTQNPPIEEVDIPATVKGLARVLFNNLALQFASIGLSEPDVYDALFQVSTRLGAIVCTGNGHLSGLAADANSEQFYKELLNQMNQVEPPKAKPTPKFSSYLN